MKLLRNKKYIALYILPVFIIIVIFYPNATASVNSYPTEGWQITTPEQRGMRSQMLADMMAVIKENRYAINSVLVVRNGHMVLDAYFHPFTKDLRHQIHSCTKSIMSALIGIAIEKGYIKSVNQPILDFFPDKAIANMDDRKKSMTLEDLLMMASGLDCRDSYLYVWKGLFEMKNSEDWAQYVLDLPMADPPGKSFEYCNGVSYLLSVIIQKTTKMKTLDFVRENLFDPLGISEIFWETSPQGIDIGWGEMWLKPEDMAKIGLLYLNGGRWGKKQIVPASWVEASTRGHIEATLFDRYGYQWWVDAENFYMAVGYRGQFIFVVPDKHLVVVFTGDLPPGTFFIPRELMIKYIIPAAASSAPLPVNPEETARLDNLVKSAATASADGSVWLTREDGMAKDGIFRRAKFPKFMFTYPPGSKKESAVAPGQVMRMKTPDNVSFEASVIDIPGNLGLEDFGPKFYAAALQRWGSDVEVMANKEITLKCGTKAYRTVIKWVWNNPFQLTSVVVSSYKDNKCVYLAVHPMLDLERFSSIVESLTFE